jgi:hypothetical protein
MTDRTTFVWQKLSTETISFLFRYYFILFLIGIFLSIFSLCCEPIAAVNCIPWHIQIPLSIVAIIGGIGTSLLGATIFYLRRLYKHCIQGLIRIPSEGNSLQETGVFYYYYLRPFFAVAFSLLIHLSVKSGVHIMVVKEANLETGFVYVVMLLSFFAGFASGDVISYLEDKSGKLLENVIK